MTCFRVAWAWPRRKKKRIRDEEKKKNCPTPSEDFLFHEMRTYCESYRVSPALCLPNLLLLLRLPGAVKAFKGSNRRAEESPRRLDINPLSRLRQINEKEGSAQSKWSYFGFPLFGVEWYSLVVVCSRRRVSWTFNSQKSSQSFGTYFSGLCEEEAEWYKVIIDFPYLFIGQKYDTVIAFFP